MGCNQAEQQVDRQNRQKRVTFELNSLIPMERKKKSEETESAVVGRIQLYSKSSRAGRTS